jgi:hypothetical protein
VTGIKGQHGGRGWGVRISMMGERERIFLGTETRPDQVTRILKGVRAASARSVEKAVQSSGKSLPF